MLARRPRAAEMWALIDAVGALLNRRDDVDLLALILDDDGALRVARGRRGAFLEAAVAAAARAARRVGEEALFARRLWPTNIVEVAGEAGKRALVGDGASKALRAMIDEGPLAESGEADVDAHARILGRAVTGLGRRLLSAKNSDARAFADAVATSLKRTENASFLFTDDDVVVAWRVVRGAKTPVTAPRELRDRAKDLVDARNGCLGVLFDALVSEIDLGFLDAPPGK